MSTISAKPFFTSASQASNRFANTIRHLVDTLSARNSSVPSSAARLMSMADEYENSQPSYASDLRAAAQRAMESDARAR